VIVGDLVTFTPPDVFSSAKRDYADPGIVIKVTVINMGSTPERTSYIVRWNDGRVTTEHPCYLKKAY